MNYLSQAGILIVQVCFSLYITIVMIRFLLQLVRADFYNPVSQFVVKVTTPALKPLRRLIPGYGGIDFPAIVLMLGLQIIMVFLIAAMAGMSIGLMPIVFLSIAELLSLLLNVFLFAIIVLVIVSWVNPGSYNPVLLLLQQLTEPLMKPARRLLPPISGLDLSPIVVLLGIQLAKILIVAPIKGMAGGFIPL